MDIRSAAMKVANIISGAKAAVDELKNIAVGAVSTFADSSSDVIVPTLWDDRVKQAVKYYREIDVIWRCVALSRSFVLGDGIRFVTTNDSDREKITEFARRIRLMERSSRLLTSLYSRGEAIPHKVWDGETLKRIQLVNPLSVVPTFADGELTKLVQYEYANNQRSSKIKYSFSSEEQLQNVLLLRHDVDDWDDRGEPLICRAFDKVPILLNYRRAESAVARRWTNPLRFIKLGGIFGKYIFKPTDADLKAAAKKIQGMDMNQGLVVPFHWDVKTYGTEGVVFDSTPRVAALLSQIAISMGFMPFLITGDSTGYGNARVVLKATRYQIRENAIAIATFLDWLFDENVKTSIGIAPDTKIDYQFTGLDVAKEQWEAQEDRELYDRGIMSRRSLQIRTDLNPQDEDKQIDEEPVRLKKLFSAQDIIGLVGAGVVEPAVAQALLGMTEDELIREVQAAAARHDGKKLYAKTDARMKAAASSKKRGK
jgi:hypothetical protein